ncbi:MAG: caspase family protein [Planctomycetota bacterium]
MPDRFEIREVLRDDPRFLRRAAFDTKLRCEAMLEQPGPSLRGQLPSDADERFLREAQSLAGIEHDSVVRLREVCTVDGVQTLVLALPDGPSLADRLADGTTLPADEVRRIALDLAAAAGAAHKKGVVHRGIAPENVYVAANGRAKLTGFTFAKLANAHLGATSIQHVRRKDGSQARVTLPTYSAPEQLSGQRADHRADLFAIGCVLYLALTGKEAFPLDSTEFVPPDPPHKVVPGCPVDLSQAIQKCLAYSPRERFANADELIAALMPKPAPEPRRNRLALPLAIGLSAIAVVLALRLGGGPGESTTWRGRPVVEPPREEPARYQPSYAKSWAIVIGCNYQGNQHGHRELHNAESDAVAFQQRLLALEFEKPVLLAGERDGSKPATERAIRDALNGQSKSWGPDDRLVLYFAGHGELHPQDGKTFCLLPADAGSTTDLDHWINLAEAWQPYLAAPRSPKHILVVLDCCHAGAATRSSRALSFGVTPDGEIPANYRARRSIERRARWILTSTMEDELSADGDKNAEHSPFTSTLLEQLDRAIRKEPVGMFDLFAAANQAIDRGKLRQRPLLAPVRGEESRAEFWFVPPKDEPAEK